MSDVDEGANSISVQDGGYIWERQVFGISSDQLGTPEYRNWQSAVSDTIRQQAVMGWNPVVPKTPMAVEMFECVKSYLPRHLVHQLQLYCAIGTSLDWHHGVDGFFMIQNYIVSIDLCYIKKRDYKADILIPMDQAQTRLWRICLEIATRFKMRFP